MKLSQILRVYSKWFHIFGLNCYPSFEQNAWRRSIVVTLNYLPSAVVLLLYFVCLTITCRAVILFGEIDTPGAILVAVGLATNAVAVVVSKSESLLSKSRYSSLFAQLNAIEHFARERFLFDSHLFQRKFMREVCVNILLHCGPFVVDHHHH